MSHFPPLCCALSGTNLGSSLKIFWFFEAYLADLYSKQICHPLENLRNEAMYLVLCVRVYVKQTKV